MSYPIAIIPSPGDDPSVSQGAFYTNFGNIVGWAGVDHVTYGAINNGIHNQVTFNGNNAQTIGAGVTSALYTQSGVAKSASPQLVWQNQDATFQISPIRAWGFANSGGIISSQSFNVTSVTRVAPGSYDVVLNSNVVASSNFAVLVSTIMSGPPSWGGGAYPGYVITGTGTFTLNFHAISGNFGTDPTSFSFQVMQV